MQQDLSLADKHFNQVLQCNFSKFECAVHPERHLQTVNNALFAYTYSCRMHSCQVAQGHIDTYILHIR